MSTNTERKIYWLKKDGEGDFSYVDQDGVNHNSPNEWLWSFLGGCGCGSSKWFSDKAFNLLDYFATEHLKRDEKEVDPYNDEWYELLAHWFDSVDFIEHGTSVSSSWLSDKGRQIYEQIKLLSHA